MPSLEDVRIGAGGGQTYFPMKIKAALRSSAESISGLPFSGGLRRRRWIGSAVFLLLLLPLLFIGTFSYLQSSRDLTANAYSRRQSLAYLAATTFKQRLDHLKDIGVALGTRVRFRQLIGAGKWNEAAEILRQVPKDFPFIERLFLTDPAGTLIADVPELPGVRGRNFAFRDWYKGVSRNWLPYVSDVYQRAGAPRYDVIAITVPIKADDQSVLGILVLQIRLDTLVEWIRAIEVGPSGFVYVVDRKAHVAAHPKFQDSGKEVDFSAVPAVQKALRGERGIEAAWNPVEKEERIVAYEPVPDYNWAVFVQQPASAAFEVRDASLKRLLLSYGLILVFTALLAYLILHVISERRRVGEKMRKLNEELKSHAAEQEAANKELEAFSYSVSHDLRAPLRAVNGFSRILLEKHGAALPPEAMRYQKLICENAQQMGRLIDDLLAFSRLSRQPLKRQAVEPRQIVDEALHHLSRESGNGRPRISVDDLPACQADPALLKQVYVNLISNAIKYSHKREDARIEIGCMDGDGPPTYYVRDNGVGFEMKYADKLFGVFQRLHRAEEYEGTGVGLAIVQRIVNRHGGRVWADAGIEKGATFYFTLGGPVA
jgi:signal transduction histidine kinase